MFQLMDQFEWVESRGYVTEFEHLEQLIQSAIQGKELEQKERPALLITADPIGVIVFLKGRITVEARYKLTFEQQKELINEFLYAFEYGRRSARYALKERIASGFNLHPDRVDWPRFLNAFVPGHEDEVELL